MGYVITRTMVVGVESEKESNTVEGSFGVHLRLMWPLLNPALQLNPRCPLQVLALSVQSKRQIRDQSPLLTSRSIQARPMSLARSNTIL